MIVDRAVVVLVLPDVRLLITDAAVPHIQKCAVVAHGKCSRSCAAAVKKKPEIDLADHVAKRRGTPDRTRETERPTGSLRGVAPANLPPRQRKKVNRLDIRNRRRADVFPLHADAAGKQLEEMPTVPVVIVHLGQKNAVRQLATGIELFAERGARLYLDKTPAHCLDYRLISGKTIAIINDDQLP